MNIHFLSLEEVLSIQQQLINTFGGLPGLRDVALLEAALMRPQSGYYTTLKE